jgi:enoyl-CoA hydratase/carnithine racemase
VTSSILLDIAGDGRTASLTFNRPEKLNALSRALLGELIEACAVLDRQPDLRAVVVRGAGERAFSAGFDLGDFGAAGDGDDAYASADLGRRAADALERLHPITIAAIRGHCIGGGVVLAAACDLRIAADDTRFAIPEIDLGIPLAWGGIPRLARELGPALTKELVITARPFSAAEAHAWRFVNRVVAGADLESAAAELAQSIAAKPRFATLATKQQVRIAAESMSATHHADADATLLQGSLADAESRAISAAYLRGASRGKRR